MSFDEIARRLQMSRHRVIAIHDRALRKVRRRMLELGVGPADIKGIPGSMLARAQEWAESEQ